MAEPLTLISLGLTAAGLAAALLGRKDPEDPVADDRRTNPGTLGSRTPFLLGRNTEEPPFGFYGNRRIIEKSSPGGKGSVGGAGVDILVYEEDGVLFLGDRFDALHKIYTSGDVF